MMKQLGHMRIREDKNGKKHYQMIIEAWRNGKKYYKSKTFLDEKEAKKWGRTTRYEIDEGLVSKETLKNRKLSHAIERYIKEALPNKPRNARNVEQHLRWWKDEIGHLKLGGDSDFIAQKPKRMHRKTFHHIQEEIWRLNELGERGIFEITFGPTHVHLSCAQSRVQTN